MAVFPEDTYTNLTNITQIFEVTQTFTDGTIGLGLWLMISMGAFFLMAKFNSKEALIASSFVSIVAGLFLAFIGLLNGVFIMVAFVLYIIAMIFLITSKSGLGA